VDFNYQSTKQVQKKKGDMNHGSCMEKLESRQES